MLSIEIVGRNFEPFSGGMRRRRAVRLDGDEELFLIKDADAAKSALDQFMAERPLSPARVGRYVLNR